MPFVVVVVIVVVIVVVVVVFGVCRTIVRRSVGFRREAATWRCIVVSTSPLPPPRDASCPAGLDCQLCLAPAPSRVTRRLCPPARFRTLESKSLCARRYRLSLPLSSISLSSLPLSSLPSSSLSSSSPLCMRDGVWVHAVQVAGARSTTSSGDTRPKGQRREAGTGHLGKTRDQRGLCDTPSLALQVAGVQHGPIRQYRRLTHPILEERAGQASARTATRPGTLTACEEESYSYSERAIRCKHVQTE